ncbi:MAG: magnesium transporter, partial [Candidatus Neoclostridium sp.]
MDKQLFSLYSDRDFIGMAKILEDCSSEELAAVLGEIAENDLVLLCRELNPDAVAEALVQLPSDKQSVILSGLHDDQLKEVMDEVSVDDTLEIIEDMPNSVVVRIAEEEEIKRLLDEKNFKVLKPLLASIPAVDIAKIFSEIDKEELPIVFRVLPKALAADTFVELDSDLQQFLIDRLSDKELKAVMDELFVDDTVDIIEEMPANVVKRMLAQTDKEMRDGINEILKYEKDSAGSIMTVEFVRVRPDMTVAEAFEQIRKTGIDKETIYTCYVTDNKSKLIGIVTAKTLLLNNPSTLLRDIMVDNVIYCRTSDDKEEVARVINKYGFLALPVVDNEERLVGIVTVDDAMDVIQEENTEDFEKIHAIVPSDKPYLKTGVFSLFLHRLPWLLILMISATFTGLILNNYEEHLSVLGGSLLIACVPMLMDTGGNSGTQACVTIIRGLALDQIRFKDILRVQWKELRTGVLLALSLVLVCFAKLTLVDRLLLGFEYTPMIAFIVSLSLAITIIVAKLVGCSLPLVAKAVKLDPAVVASPIITTIVDALSL